MAAHCTACTAWVEDGLTFCTDCREKARPCAYCEQDFVPTHHRQTTHRGRCNTEHYKRGLRRRAKAARDAARAGARQEQPAPKSTLLGCTDCAHGELRMDGDRPFWWCHLAARTACDPEGLKTYWVARAIPRGG